MLIVLDNAESILDPQGVDAQEIYTIVEELSQLDNICLCITSRLSAIPSDCEILEVPTLSIDAARDVFYRIYRNAQRSDLVDGILAQLDFHPLSITLLATVALQNKWDTDRLTRKWEQQRTRMLQTIHNKSFATTIELSLGSPMFQELGPDARALLEVVAFLPQGVNEDNLGCLFPTISNITDILDKFCVLSLTHRSNSFVTMLSPLRDHLRPKDPKSSALLCTTKKQYFTWMADSPGPGDPGFEETGWIISEDVNVEHLLDVFMTLDANSKTVWDACEDFISLLIHHKQRLTILLPKIEGLPDTHPSKPGCLSKLSRLFHTVGNQSERKRLLTHTLKLRRQWGSERSLARTLREISAVSRHMDLYEEGIQASKEASEIYKRLGDTSGEAQCLTALARLFKSNNRLDAAEEAASRALDLYSGKGEQYRVCGYHRLLATTYHSKGETEKAMYHFKAALAIASSDWGNELYRIHRGLAKLFLDEDKLDDAQTHLEQAKLRAVNHPYHLGHVARHQAELWYKQGRLDEAGTEALRAADEYEKLGAAKDLEGCSQLLRQIEDRMGKLAVSDESVNAGGFLVR